MAIEVDIDSVSSSFERNESHLVETLFHLKRLGRFGLALETETDLLLNSSTNINTNTHLKRWQISNEILMQMPILKNQQALDKQMNAFTASQ